MPGIGRVIMWALGLIIGTLIGALVAQGSGAFVGGVVGLVAGIIFGLQRKTVKRRVETPQSPMLDLEARRSALGQTAAAPPPPATPLAPAAPGGPLSAGVLAPPGPGPTPAHW